MRLRYIAPAFLIALTVVVSGRANDEFRFPLKPASVRFAVIGDMGTGDEAQYVTAKTLVDMRKSFPYDFVTMLGDNIYSGTRQKILRSSSRSLISPYWTPE